MYIISASFWLQDYLTNRTLHTPAPLSDPYYRFGGHHFPPDPINQGRAKAVGKRYLAVARLESSGVPPRFFIHAFPHGQPAGESLQIPTGRNTPPGANPVLRVGIGGAPGKQQRSITLVSMGRHHPLAFLDELRETADQDGCRK